MECIKCKIVEANKGSGLCYVCENDELSKINGLLYLPALGLILGIIYSTIDVYSFTISVLEYFNKTGFLSYYAMGAFAFLICGFLVSLYAAWLFFRRKKGTRKAMIAYYTTGLVIALYFTVLPAILFNAQPGSDDARVLVSGIFGAVIWIPYFIFSKRINTVFCR